MSNDDLDGMTVLDFATNGDSFHLRDQGGEVVHEYQATETSTQRPWAAVAPWSEDNDPVKARARYAAMVLAHSAAMWADGASRDSIDRHVRPMLAAFTAAAQIAVPGRTGMTLEAINEAAIEGGTPVELAADWVVAAGIDPAEIAPAL